MRLIHFSGTNVFSPMTATSTLNMTHPRSVTSATQDPNNPVLRSRVWRWGAFIVVSLVYWAIYLASGSYRRTPFNAHVYLAYAMLHGHFYLINPPGHFEMTHFAGRAYIAYGIGPSLLMLPFVAFFGLAFQQSMFSAAVAAVTVALWWSTLEFLSPCRVTRMWLTILFGLGSLFWFYGGENGNTWSLMHVTTVFGLMLAIHQIISKQHSWLSGMAFGLAVLSRQPVLLSFPFFVGMLWGRDKTSIRRQFGFAVGLCVILLFGAYYNAVRFGSFFDNGYTRVIFDTKDVNVLTWGLFNLKYARQNALIYFYNMPTRISRFPWLDPYMAGFSIFLTTPALFVAIAADYHKRINLLGLAACLTIQSLYLTYFWSGYAQFGCRYSVDYLPFVMLLAADGANNQPKWFLIVVTFLGVLIEIWGISWWLYRGW